MRDFLKPCPLESSFMIFQKSLGCNGEPEIHCSCGLPQHTIDYYKKVLTSQTVRFVLVCFEILLFNCTKYLKNLILKSKVISYPP